MLWESFLIAAQAQENWSVWHGRGNKLEAGWICSVVRSKPYHFWPVQAVIDQWGLWDPYFPVLYCFIRCFPNHDGIKTYWADSHSWRQDWRSWKDTSNVLHLLTSHWGRHFLLIWLHYCRPGLTFQIQRHLFVEVRALSSRAIAWSTDHGKAIGYQNRLALTGPWAYSGGSSRRCKLERGAADLADVRPWDHGKFPCIWDRTQQNSTESVRAQNPKDIYIQRQVVSTCTVKLLE